MVAGFSFLLVAALEGWLFFSFFFRIELLLQAFDLFLLVLDFLTLILLNFP